MFTITNTNSTESNTYLVSKDGIPFLPLDMKCREPVQYILRALLKLLKQPINSSQVSIFIPCTFTLVFIPLCGVGVAFVVCILLFSPLSFVVFGGMLG
jgi:hypothetical protein